MSKSSQKQCFFARHLLFILNMCKLRVMKCSKPLIHVSIFFAIQLLSAAESPLTASAQVIDFERVSSGNTTLSERSYHRIEHFLTHAFPMRQMRHYSHSVPNARPTRLRHVTYEIISQEGLNFVLAAYSASWSEPVNELAIYRLEAEGPNQVWRSRPWVGSSADLHLQSALARGRNIVLFREGGAVGEFGLASVFSFRNSPDGLFMRDLTPTLPWLRARAHFPFRTLYGEQISMHVEGEISSGGNRQAASLKNSEKAEVILTATDEEYNLGMEHLIRPARSWKYDQTHGRFERIKITHSEGEPEANNNQ